MNKWVKRKWVRALRSGEYVQANGVLVDGVGDNPDVRYCCLGVLLAECRPESITVNPMGYLTTGENAQGDIDLIADDLAILWDVDFATQNALSRQNDDNVPFMDIADWIEENL